LIKNHKYVIIGGTTKAGTTSLFNYLKDHPEICPSTYKETRFFINKNYPIKIPTNFHISNGIEEYENFFKHCKDDKIRMEATPDYLYSENTAKWIYENLPNSKIIFILRNPIDRLISWYRFAKQNNFLNKDVSFEDYINMQIKNNKKDKQYLLALEQGKYSKYLQSYIDLFGEDRILVIQFEDLTKNPLSTMKKISNFIGIDPNFYNNYNFEVFNKTVDLKYPKIHEIYKNFRFSIKKYTHNKPLIQKSLGFLRKNFDSIYYKINRQQNRNFRIEIKTKEFLKEYYKEDKNNN